jgi:hypothetical protein
MQDRSNRDVSFSEEHPEELRRRSGYIGPRNHRDRGSEEPAVAAMLQHLNLGDPEDRLRLEEGLGDEKALLLRGMGEEGLEVGDSTAPLWSPGGE